MRLLASRVLLSLLSAAPVPAGEPLCTGRAPCSVSETLDAGQDAQGQRLQVVALSLGWIAQRTGAKGVGRKFTGAGRDKDGRRQDGQCEALEWWLRRPGAPDQLLLSVCNDGYGAAKTGTDTVRVKDNRFSHQQSSGGDTRLIQEKTIQLAPLTLVTTHRAVFFSSGITQRTVQKWEPASLQGVVTSDFNCVKQQGSRTVPVGLRLPYLPRLQMDPAFLQSGWKQVALGGCALDALPLPLGRPMAPGDASLKAVLLGRDSLLLEVRDDHWTGPGTNWFVDDHVELWLGSAVPGELSRCGESQDSEQAEQWGIRVTDGQVFPAYGSPTRTLAVDRVELREADKIVGYRLKVKLPGTFKGLTVVYSDRDVGEVEERRLATSPLKFARPETFNPWHVAPPEEVICAVRDGSLAVVPTPLQPKAPGVAVLRN